MRHDHDSAVENQRYESKGDANTTQFERRLAKRIRTFDPLSLLLLLEQNGYNQEQIHFRSNPSNCSQEALFANIKFQKEPTPHVEVAVNAGLLGAQTCLPSYILKQLEQAPANVINSLQFFDHPMLANFFKSIYPESDTRIFAEANHIWREKLLLNLRSPCVLHWMAALLFPELDVRLEKTVLPRLLATRPFVLGDSSLGGSHVLSRSFSSAVQGLRLQLFSDMEHTANGMPWGRIIMCRLEARLFPMLAQEGVELEVFLVLREQRSWVRLSRDSFLGYDKFKGGRNQYRRLRIFSGTVLQ